ncbi:MAG: glycosyl hydrolase 53 family protein [Bacilli bacterium]|nr:glycosyl hydrolase 53 family protein [Bacilli bacterium]
MILGIDISTYLESLRLGAKYYRGGKEVDPFADIVRSNGVNYMRIRVWKDPYDENGKPYLGGTCDYQNYVELARLAKKEGCKILLDPHFSDFWCDPGKQTLPKAWQGLDEKKLLVALRKYCQKLFGDCVNDGVIPDIVQLGNEITNGMLWPFAKLSDNSPRENYPNLIKCLSIISGEVRAAFPNAARIIHLERSYDNAVYREFFDQVNDEVDFEYIGMSYYPYWHLSFDKLFANIDDMFARYGKKTIIVETGYAFTVEDYVLNPQDGSKLVIAKEGDPSTYIPFPLTKEGQEKFIEELLKGIKSHPVDGVFYWEPFWLPGDGVCWASKEGQRYIKEEKGGTRNEWANQCLYDYGGNALPSLGKYHF